MSMENNTFYNPSMKNIYSILDSLENKLGRYKTNPSYGANQNIIKSNYNDYNQNLKGNDKYIDNEYIKRIIINEFGQLILPYQKDLNFNINSLESKINSLNSKIDNIKDSNQNNNSDKKNNLYEINQNYVSRKEYMDLQNQISLMNTNIASLKNLIKKNNDNDKNLLNSKNYFQMKNDNEKNLMEEINNIKKSISLSQNINLNYINPNDHLKEYDLKINNFMENLKTIKEENKNLNGELSQIKEQINNETQKNLNETNIIELNSNELKKLNNKIQSLESIEIL